MAEEGIKRFVVSGFIHVMGTILGRKNEKVFQVKDPFIILESEREGKPSYALRPLTFTQEIGFVFDFNLDEFVVYPFPVDKEIEARYTQIVSPIIIPEGTIQLK